MADGHQPSPPVDAHLTALVDLPWEDQDDVYRHILQEKYAKDGETSADDVFRRVARGLAQVEAPYFQAMSRAQRRQISRRVLGKSTESTATFTVGIEALFHRTFRAGFYPAGRIASAAGTDIQATLINCFVQPVADTIRGTDADGRVGIYPALEQAAETMRRGGGVGYNFTRIRPRGARVHGTHSTASGPMSYMRVFDRSCETVESAGARRGAQMGILACDHPDILEFIHAKNIGRFGEYIRSLHLDAADSESFRAAVRNLTNFNISVAITDELMHKAQRDESIELVHPAEPGDAALADGAYQRDDGLWVYTSMPAAELLEAIVRHTYDHAEPGVFFVDSTNRENNLRYCETIDCTNPCGEQPLPAYGCCCLGSVNLACFVRDPFGNEPTFDFDAYARVVAVGTRVLDNVLDATFWPLDEQRREAMNKRRVGQGYTGLGTAMAMLGIRYGSAESIAFTEQVTRTLRDSAYRASVELAAERGSFPLLDAERYLDSAFARRLPDDLRDAIAQQGIRNSHLVSIAPTGTITNAFGRNVSGGIEPTFALEAIRTKRMADGSRQRFPIRDYGYRVYLHLGGDPDNLPESFVTAMDSRLTPDDHMSVMAAAQPYVDSAISKTVNCPADMPLEDFKAVYVRAWQSGLKGCTTYRPNESTGAVLEVADAPRPADEAPQDLDTSDPDRRLVLRDVPAPALESLKWPGRPVLPAGNPSITYMVEGDTARFAVFVGHTDNGAAYPFEVWVNGAEQPRGLGATAKLLSMDMRSQDRGWLARKLDSLMTTSGAPIRCAMPPDGQVQTLGSSTAVMARLVRLRCEQLGAFAQSGPTPVLDALMSAKEPKTGTDGTMSWTVDVANPSTGDEFIVILKECVMPDGQRRPYSMWLSGDYPREFDGLCKLLSHDMRIVDPAWVGSKLGKLLSFAEAGGDFMARIPGTERGAIYPSTIAYIAALMLHRYELLGILDTDGNPCRPMGVLQGPQSDTRPADNRPPIGERCPDCAALAVVKYGGCRICGACGWEGACG